MSKFDPKLSSCFVLSPSREIPTSSSQCVLMSSDIWHFLCRGKNLWKPALMLCNIPSPKFIYRLLSVPRINVISTRTELTNSMTKCSQNVQPCNSIFYTQWLTNILALVWLDFKSATTNLFVALLSISRRKWRQSLKPHFSRIFFIFSLGGVVLFLARCRTCFETQRISSSVSHAFFPRLSSIGTLSSILVYLGA
jgi:hypothetical protein